MDTALEAQRALGRALGRTRNAAGRRDPRELVVGEPLDFWRVAGFEDGRVLSLVAEMRLPGQAWLEFEVRPAPGGCELHQTARFVPAGLLGLLYWYAIHPLHLVVFRSMLRGIARDATKRSHPDLPGRGAAGVAPPERVGARS